ncbi:MAG: MMPL family transporter [Gammaproteobacteria bacterium]|nr:MMPL family transporter [Gammaproteobacteria bacterium]
MIEAKKRVARRYAEFVLRFRRPIMILVLAATVLGALQIENIDMRNDPDTLLPPSNRYVVTNLYAEHTFGMGNLMVFGLKLKEGDIYQPWFINTVQNLHREIAALPTANKVNFISLAAQKVKYMSADEMGLVFKRLIPTQGISTDDPELAKKQLAFLKEGLEDNPVMGPMLLYREDADGQSCKFGQSSCTTKATFIIGDYSDEVKTIYLPWVRQVRDIMKRYGEDERIELLVAGEPYFFAYMLLDLLNKWWLFAFSLLIVLGVLWSEFRTWRGALFPLLGVGATIVITMGLMGVSAFKLTTMMVLTPMLLLAIGIGHSVQVTRRFGQEFEACGDARTAALAAMERTIVPATLAIITDMAGFATLALVDISFYKAYAYFGMFGMLTLLLTTTTLIPLLMVTFPPKQVSKETCDAEGWEVHVGTRLLTLLSGPGKWVPVAAVLGIIAWSAHSTGITQADMDDIMPKVEKGINCSRAAFKGSSVTIQHIVRLGEIMPGVISVNIPIRGKEALKPECDMDGLPEGCHDPDEMAAQGIFNNADVLGDIAKMEDWMQAHPYIGFTGSYAQYIKLVNMLLAAEPGEPAEMKHFRIPTREYLLETDPEDDRDANEITAMYNGLLEVMTSAGDMDSYVTPDWHNGVIMGFVNTMDPVKTHQVVVDIQKYTEEHKNDAGFRQVNFGFRNADTSGDTNELSVEGPNYLEPGLGGFLGATEAAREVALKEWLKSPLLTAMAIFLIAALIFRSLAISAILMVILFITLFAQYGLGGYFTSVQNWSGNPHFATLVALSIAMGLGVDYGIYMISRLREEMQSAGADWTKALGNTLRTTGSAIIVSVLVLLGSFIPLVGTDLANTWALGVYISEALIIDMFTALTLLPLLVYLLKPKYVFAGRFMIP